MDNDITDEYNNLLNGIVDSYNLFMEACCYDIQEYFIDNMSEFWISDNSVFFYNNQFLPSMRALINSSSRIYENIYEAVKTILVYLGSIQGINFELNGFPAIEFDYDISNITNNGRGLCGINMHKALECSSYLGDALKKVVISIQNATIIIESSLILNDKEKDYLLSGITAIGTKVQNSFIQISVDARTQMEATRKKFNSATLVRKGDDLWKEE